MSYGKTPRKESGILVRGRKRIRSVGSNPLAGISLTKRRRWYGGEASDTDDATGDDKTPPGADDLNDGGDDGEDDNEDAIPQEVADLPEWVQVLLKKTRDEAASHRAKLREVEEARKAQELKDAEEKGEFKKLWEDGAADREELARLRQARSARLETVKARNETRIGELAKDKQVEAREIIEIAGTDDPDKVSAILDKIIPTLGASPNPPPMDGGAKGNSRKNSGSSGVKLNKAGF